MPNMGRFVWVDIRVLENDLSVRSGCCSDGIPGKKKLFEERLPLKEEVDIARPGDLNFGHTFDLSNGISDLFGDLPWRFAHYFRQLKAKGKRQVAHLGFWRLFNDQLVQTMAILSLDVVDESLFNPLNQRQEH